MPSNVGYLRNKLNNTAGGSDLLLSQLAHPSRPDDQGDLGDAALAQNLRVTQGKQVKNGGGLLLLARDVGVTGLLGNQRPQLQSLLVGRSVEGLNPRELESAVRESRDIVVGAARREVSTLSMLITGFQKWFCCLWK